jgi:hypothetical protein
LESHIINSISDDELAAIIEAMREEIRRKEQVLELETVKALPNGRHWEIETRPGALTSGGSAVASEVCQFFGFSRRSQKSEGRYVRQKHPLETCQVQSPLKVKSGDCIFC